MKTILFLYTRSHTMVYIFVKFTSATNLTIDMFSSCRDDMDLLLHPKSCRALRCTKSVQKRDFVLSPPIPYRFAPACVDKHPPNPHPVSISQDGAQGWVCNARSWMVRVILYAHWSYFYLGTLALCRIISKSIIGNGKRPP
jgi:hypothetical protein